MYVKENMFEIINPGLLSVIVDNGRYGYAGAGIPSSSALDKYAFRSLNALLGNNPDDPVIEVTGVNFSIRIHFDTVCAITGAKVIAQIDNSPLNPWTSVKVKKNSLLRVNGVTEGFRFYVGVSGTIDAENVVNSYSTNLECGFGGFLGRALIKGDMIGLKEKRIACEDIITDEFIPSMRPPHKLRIMEGPEIGYFKTDSIEKLFDIKKNYAEYTISAQSNRTGIRLDGEPILFMEGADKSIISEGVMPGTLQVPGNGQPIIMLHERTIGGYARLGIVAKTDIDLLAHLKPGDKVTLELISVEEAENLWSKKLQKYHNKLIQLKHKCTSEVNS